MVKDTIAGILIQDNFNHMLNHCDRLKDNATDLEKLVEKIEGSQKKKLNITKPGMEIDNGHIKQLEALCFKLKNLADEQTKILGNIKIT